MQLQVIPLMLGGIVAKDVKMCKCGAEMSILFAPVGVHTYLCSRCGNADVSGAGEMTEAMEMLSDKFSKDGKDVFAILEPLGVRVHKMTDKEITQ